MPYVFFDAGHKWHYRRKILTPAFHFNVLQQFAAIFSQEADCLTRKLLDKTDEPYVNIVPYISEFTLNSITGNKMETFNLHYLPNLVNYRNK